jgi:hypothetical protein
MMPDRPYLTSAEAATYCGFKTIGGIQQAVRRGKLKPAGRRGGTGTYVFAREDLDAFLTGGLKPHERLFVPPAPSAEEEPTPLRSAAAEPRVPRHKPAAEPSPESLAAAAAQAPPRSRKPVTPEDPVARIIRALTTPAPKVEKGGARPAKR